MHSPTQHRLWVVVALVSALGSGCTYSATTRLDYSPEATAPRPAPVAIAVVPLQEGRPPRADSSQFARGFLTFVPLIPYVSMPYERLDESHQLAVRERGGTVHGDELFTHKMALAVANDLQQSRVVDAVRYAPDGAPDADYVLTGTLRKTQFDVHETSYMLGLPGVLLWVLPLPIGSNGAAVHIDLELRDRAGQTVWQHPLRGDARQLFTLYGSSGAPVSDRVSLEIIRFGSNDKGIDPDSLWAYHADALRSGMSDAKPSLAAFLASRTAAVGQH